MDLLTSGPERPQRASRTGRRSVRVAAVVVLAAVALVLLRSTVDTGSPGASRSIVDRPVATGSLPPQPTPPFDRLPGRTPIPPPAQTGDGVSGPLPAVGAPDKRAAGAAVDLVLGRYCLDPRRFTYTLEPDRDASRADWRHVDVLVFRLADSGSGPAQRIFLDWVENSQSYRWLGFLDILDGC